MQRKVIISVPTKGKVQLRTHLADVETPYKLINSARRDWRTLPYTEHDNSNKNLIRDIVPIHNVEGLRDIAQVPSMLDTIRADQHILEHDELPNIKLVTAPDGQLLLFDGHHSLLAYFQHGRRHLEEVPHVLISTVDDGPLEVSEITSFYPQHAEEKILANWQDYVVNWQREESEQLEKREAINFEQLAKEFSSINQ